MNDLGNVNHDLHQHVEACYNHAQELRGLVEIELLENDLPTSRGAAKARHALFTLAKYICKVMISDLEIQLNMEEGVQGNRVDELRNDLLLARGNLEEIEVEITSIIETERGFVNQD